MVTINSLDTHYRMLCFRDHGTPFQLIMENISSKNLVHDIMNMFHLNHISCYLPVLLDPEWLHKQSCSWDPPCLTLCINFIVVYMEQQVHLMLDWEIATLLESQQFLYSSIKDCEQSSKWQVEVCKTWWRIQLRTEDDFPFQILWVLLSQPIMSSEASFHFSQTVTIVF